MRADECDGALRVRQRDVLAGARRAEKAQATSAREIVMPMEPTSPSGFRPTLSTSIIATTVPTMFTIEVVNE